jgi:tRNA G10  N-methylase Trm11
MKSKTFFILGRNPELSREEVLAYLRARNREHTEILFEKNLLVLETNEGEKFDIQEFGGVMWLGPINFEGNEEELAEYLEKTEIVPADKFSYATFGSLDSEPLKELFKSRKKKAMLKHGRQQIEFQGGEKQDIPNAEFNIFFHEYKNKVYLGTSTQTYDSFKVKERDMKKPVRREHLAISPRLSKILINLSGAKPRDLLLDPFCGVGGILQEALIKKMDVHGIDKDKQATVDAIKNLKWITEKYGTKNNFKIENLDSRKAPDLQFAAIATETPLGKVLRKKPNDNEAQQIIQNFEAYMIPILSKLKNVKKPNAKIAITFPVIRNLHVDTPKIAQKTGLKVLIKPILESREDQFISRDIIVFQ